MLAIFMPKCFLVTPLFGELRPMHQQACSRKLILPTRGRVTGRNWCGGLSQIWGGLKLMLMAQLGRALIGLVVGEFSVEQMVNGYWDFQSTWAGVVSCLMNSEQLKWL
ncbi:hypothetical protein SESBI_35884 [Sesbania bispinosa]|nr:hypothetical protein SESBI_35884 [Sesbania bispinosa]